MNDLRVIPHLLAKMVGLMTRVMEENFHAARIDKPNDALFAIHELASELPTRIVMRVSCGFLTFSVSRTAHRTTGAQISFGATARFDTRECA